MTDHDLEGAAEHAPYRSMLLQVLDRLQPGWWEWKAQGGATHIVWVGENSVDLVAMRTTLVDLHQAVLAGRVRRLITPSELLFPDLPLVERLGRTLRAADLLAAGGEPRDYVATAAALLRDVVDACAGRKEIDK
ncbi:hypothetical protein [Pseudoclavibacter sp. 13-3]|uniref:hypothetical protein n=1 Tax=Pseudoclavibacter sp. 13-3 TaxID=2901228 RepID=UPI001E5B8CA8|nr:hypothetical protein [Pseudoclavibacter sp. 13-3]MCD7100467.1 hypothetical protein [Pseudoclavibacter sp. 13-3]